MKSVLVIGLGRFGRHLSRKFIEEGNAVLAIEKMKQEPIGRLILLMKFKSVMRLMKILLNL